MRWLLMLLPLAFLASRAADPPPPPAKLRFLFLEEGEFRYELRVNGGFVPIGSAPYRISAPIRPPDLKALEIYKLAPLPHPETGETVRSLIATVTPPDDTSSSLVLVKPGPEGVVLEHIDCDPAVLPAGTLTILNRGLAAVAVEVDGGIETVRPGESGSIRPKADARHRIRVRVAAQGDGGWQLIQDGVAILRPETRMIGLCVYSPSGLSFRIGEDLVEKLGVPPPSHVWLSFSDTP